MYTESNVNLYHITGINSEFLPEEFAALRTNHLNILVDKATSNKVQKTLFIQKLLSSFK